MKIFCNKCKKYLGVIREATLRKGIVYLCKECDTQRAALELKYNNDYNFTDYQDIFDEMFGRRLWNTHRY